MRILTVRQPWAWAIIHGQKGVENRSTNLAGGYRGSVAIHAGLSKDAEAVRHPLIIETWHANRDTYRLHFGQIIGVADLTDVHHSSSCPGRTVVEDFGPDLVRGYHAQTCSPWAELDAWHLVLANPRPLSDPIPYKGALGLRTLPGDVIAAINERTQS